MKHITHGIAKREGLVSVSRKKSLADRTVVENILNFLWKYDEFKYDQSRQRVQLALAILITTYMGLRPGEQTESNAHQGSNEGLHWGDITLFVIPDEHGKRIWLAQIRVRNRKGNRQREDKTYVHVTNEAYVLC